jgi:hypothetical protein
MIGLKFYLSLFFADDCLSENGFKEVAYGLGSYSIVCDLILSRKFFFLSVNISK